MFHFECPIQVSLVEIYKTLRAKTINCISRCDSQKAAEMHKTIKNKIYCVRECTLQFVESEREQNSFRVWTWKIMWQNDS